MAVHDVLAALGEPTRLLLVERLCEHGEQSIGPLLSEMGMTRQGARKHLKVLQDANVIFITKVGREQHVSLNTAELDESRLWLQRRTELWRRHLGALKLWAEAQADLGAAETLES